MSVTLEVGGVKQIDPDPRGTGDFLKTRDATTPTRPLQTTWKVVPRRAHDGKDIGHVSKLGGSMGVSQESP